MPVSASSPEPVSEVLYGTTVVDPYRWLEERSSADTEAWIADQQHRHDAYFAAILGFDALCSSVRAHIDVEVIDQPARVGSQFFYRHRKKNQEQPCIYVSDSDAGDGRVLVDPSPHGEFASVAIHCVSADGCLLAYELKCGGTDAKAIRIVETASGQELPDHLPTGYARGFAFAPRGTGFYYCHETASAASEHTVRFHRFGHPRDDRVLFRIARGPRTRLLLIADEVHLGAIHLHDASDGVVVDFYVAPLNDDPQWTLVFANKVPPHVPFLRRGRIFVLTEEGAPKGRVIEVARDGGALRVVVPESESWIRQLIPARDHFYITCAAGDMTTVQRWTEEGVCTGIAELSRDGSIQVLPNLSPSSTSFFYTHESFTEPLQGFEYRPESGKSVPLTEGMRGVEPGAYNIEQVLYRAKDGTQIPMSLVMRRNLDFSKPQPAILTGYGGFGVSMTPKFSVLVTILLELGALFALPNIRGGAEFGKAWHEAARRRKRQTAFDDFIAAAEWLVRERRTSPRQLAIFGGSNSGLLVGVAMTQRPDLFRAVLSIAPLLDMVRYEQFDHAREWRHEYGTVEDAADFAALYSYSPYHRIRPDTNYPATLFVSGDRDDRCNPAHVRKMAARLQDGNAQSQPILVDYSRERGHSPTLPLTVRTQALARRIAFLCKELNIQLPTGGRNENEAVCN